MHYKYMYVEEVENICLERYCENDIFSGYVIKNADGNLVVSNDGNALINKCLAACGIERKIVKFHSLSKKLFKCIVTDKKYGNNIDCVYGNITTHHFIYVTRHEDDSIMPSFDDNLNIIVYYKEEDVAPYCDDADVIYSYDKVKELPFDQRMTLFCKYY